jgi:hypothetical protein
MIVLNYVLPDLKILEFAFLFEIFDISLCLLLVPRINVASVLDVHQLHIPFSKILMYTENSLLHLMEF